MAPVDNRAFPSGIPRLSLPTLDPTHFTALHSLDLGSLYSPDGREHVIDGQTPVVVTFHPSTDPAATTGNGTTATDPTTGQPAAAGGSSFLSGLLPSWPAHFGARVTLAVLAVGILLLVVWRLSK